MVYLTLQHQSFKNIQMNVDIKEDSEIELESTFSFGISYNEDNTACIAKLQQVLRHKNDPEELSILVEERGHFLCEGITSDEAKKEAHVMAYTQLFPYIQSIIARLTVDAGLPPLMINMERLNPEDVEISNNSPEGV